MLRVVWIEVYGRYVVIRLHRLCGAIENPDTKLLDGHRVRRPAPDLMLFPQMHGSAVCRAKAEELGACVAPEDVKVSIVLHDIVLLNGLSIAVDLVKAYRFIWT